MTTRILSFTLPAVAALLFTAGEARAAIIAAYAFDETSGDTAADSVRDASGAGTLSNFGGSQWIAGKIGNAVDFDGTDDYILAPNAGATGMTGLTVSAWVWADSAPNWGTIIKNWGGASAGAFHLGFNLGSGQISNYVSNGANTIDPAVLSLNTWHHVAFVFDGASTSQTLYIDGVSVATSNVAGGALNWLGTNMGVGVKTDDSTTVPDPANPGLWDGRIDDLVMWDEALTGAQIAQIKTNGDNGISAAVPEPGSLLLLLTGVSGLLRRRR